MIEFGAAGGQKALAGNDCCSLNTRLPPLPPPPHTHTHPIHSFFLASPPPPHSSFYSGAALSVLAFPVFVAVPIPGNQHSPVRKSRRSKSQRSKSPAPVLVNGSAPIPREFLTVFISPPGFYVFISPPVSRPRPRPLCFSFSISI